MKKKLALLILLSSIGCTISEAVTLEQVLPIKGVWSFSIFGDGTTAAIRFKGGDDTSQIVQLSNTGHAEIRETETWKIIREFENVRFITRTPDSKIVGVLYGDKTAKIFELENNNVIKELNNVHMLCFARGGQFLKVTYATTTQLLDSKNGYLIQEFNTAAEPLLPYALHDNYVGIVGTNGKARIVTVEKGEVIKEFIDAAVKEHGLHISPDGKYTTITYKNGVSHLMEVGAWKVIEEFKNSKLLDFSWDSKYLLHKDFNNTLKIIDINDFHTQLQVSDVTFSGISKKSKYVWVIRGDNTAHVIDVATGKVVIGGLNNAEECSFMPNERKIVIALSDEIRVYDLIENI